MFSILHPACLFLPKAHYFGCNCCWQGEVIKPMNIHINFLHFFLLVIVVLLIVLVAAALCVALASMMWSGIHPDDKPPRQSLQRLATMVGGVAIVVIGVALLGIGGIPFRYADPLADLGALVGRIAGVAVAVACLRLTRLATE